MVRILAAESKGEVIPNLNPGRILTLPWGDGMKLRHFATLAR
jgi:hypothetical protein